MGCLRWYPPQKVPADKYALDVPVFTAFITHFQTSSHQKQKSQHFKTGPRKWPERWINSFSPTKENQHYNLQPGVVYCWIIVLDCITRRRCCFEGIDDLTIFLLRVCLAYSRQQQPSRASEPSSAQRLETGVGNYSSSSPSVIFWNMSNCEIWWTVPCLTLGYVLDEILSFGSSAQWIWLCSDNTRLAVPPPSTLFLLSQQPLEMILSSKN